MQAIGQRVGAIESNTDTEVNFFGYGIRIEDEIPSENSGGFGPMLHELGRTNPTILLDSGEKVYGCECWWGSEALIKQMVKGKKINLVKRD
jgi:hypothetical protein